MAELTWREEDGPQCLRSVDLVVGQVFNLSVGRNSKDRELNLGNMVRLETRPTTCQRLNQLTARWMGSCTFLEQRGREARGRFARDISNSFLGPCRMIAHLRRKMDILVRPPELARIRTDRNVHPT